MKRFDSNRPRFAPYGFSCETWEPQVMSRADQHDEIELNYLTGGSLTYLMGGRRVLVPAERLAVFWGTVPHQIVEYEGNSPYYVATVPFSWFLRWAIPSRLYLRVLHWEMVVDDVDSEPERERSMFEQWINDVADESLTAAVALEIQARLLRLARHLANPQQGTDYQPTGQWESHDKAEQMACHIYRNYRGRLTLPQIAGEVGLHPDYAAKLFKQTFGSTIVNFITRHRIAHAQRMLLSTDDQIIKIAVESGFDSLSRFNHAFKQFAGTTPRQYRADRRLVDPP